MKTTLLLRGAAALCAALCSAAASATTIDFSALPGSTGDTLGTYVQAGFTVTPTNGSWKEAHAFGNAAPSVYVEDLSSTPFGSLSVAVQVASACKPSAPTAKRRLYRQLAPGASGCSMYSNSAPAAASRRLCRLSVTLPWLTTV